jgi:hypothetical protein
MIELRRGLRHDVVFAVTAEHRRLGEVPLNIVNISDQGFMSLGEVDIDRGERIEVRLPVIGRIEAHLVWRHGGRSGFQLERIVRPDDFQALLAILKGKEVRPRS